MAKRIGSVENFVSELVHGVARASYFPDEGSEVEDICEFLWVSKTETIRRVIFL